MNQTNLKILESLSKKEYKRFLQSALGIRQFFAMNYGNFVIKSQGQIVNENKRHDNEKIFAYCYTKNDNKLISYYWYDESKYESFTFYQKSYPDLVDSEKYFTTKYFDDYLGDEIIFYLLLGSKDGHNYSILLKNENIYLDKNYKHYRDISINDIKSNSFTHSFILGSGVDYFLNMVSWDDLIDKMKKIASSSLGTTEDAIVKFQKKIENTGYIIPQFAKDSDKISYYQTIYDGLYSKLSLEILDTNINQHLNEETIYQIAEILAAQTAICSDPQKVITFNYDDVLENIFVKNFPQVHCQSLFPQCKKDAKSNIYVIHTHGFLPFSCDPKDKEYADSIVLSSFEYMDAYSETASYAYKELYDQLHKKNLIIGNSISDYEEQKVFRNHHRTYLSEYSYLVTFKSPEPWMDAYRMMFFLNIGVIPVFFDNSKGIVAFLKDLIPSDIT